MGHFKFYEYEEAVGFRQMSGAGGCDYFQCKFTKYFLGCDYMVFLPSISLCNEKEGKEIGCLFICTSTNSVWLYVKRLALVIYGWQVKMA